MKSTRIIIFAKAPQAGFAKTRLIPALGAAGAAELAHKMLLHTLQQALIANVGTVELAVTPDMTHPAWQGVTLPAAISISAQGEGDLGDRLARAAARSIKNAEPVLLIGTDCVELTSQLLRGAAQALQDHDAVIHCTADGGYALLGLNQFSQFLFNNVPWSSDAVASTTLSRIGQLEWSVHVGSMLHDVDEPEDLKYLPEQWRSYAVA